jgi:N-acetylmuramoyl-L-alanine amidase
MPIHIQRSIRVILVSTFLSAGTVLPLDADGIDDVEKGIRTVVIDAGHGGKDSGAVGKNAKEKDIALAVALKLGHYIEEKMPEVEVVYTRTEDVFPELWKRAEIANEAEADLFISIHVNASPKSSIKGTMTLVLGQHRADENFDVAVRENSVILLEEDYETRYEGFDPKSSESYIIFSLMQKTYFKQSIEFGDFVQDQFRERASRRDLGVREQGLYVLAQTSMPGVLVEIGFISNPEEEKYLMTEYGQDIIASAIYRGFRDYKEEIERRSNFTSVVEEEPEEAEVIEDAPDEVIIPPDQVVFSIQIASSKNKTDTDPSSFKGHEGVQVIEDGRWFKYMIGPQPDYHKALDLCQELKSDFPDAFVVALKNGKLLPLSEALVEINK